MRDTLSPSGLPGLANRRAVMNICSCLRILESYLPRSPRPCLERMPATRGMRAIGQCPQCGMNQIRVERFLPLSDRPDGGLFANRVLDKGPMVETPGRAAGAD